MVFTIEIVKNNQEFIAKCKELNIFSYGHSSEKAVQRLKKVIGFYVQAACDYLDVDTAEVKKDVSLIETKDLN